VLWFHWAVPRFPPETGARTPSRRILRKMNAGAAIRDALLVQKMKQWLSRARYSSTTSYPKWRARRNYWFLVRKHRSLAERYGLRETDVF
jgi:hypothetical protein